VELTNMGGPKQLGLQFLAMPVALYNHRKVAKGAGEHAFFRDRHFVEGEIHGKRGAVPTAADDNLSGTDQATFIHHEFIPNIELGPLLIGACHQ
jgi:hypothetical protein